MVQIFNLPTPLSLGSNLGQAIGQGAQAGSQTLLNQQFQRSQLQNALSQVGGLNQNSSPFDVAKTLLSATAGLPDQGRIVSALYQPLLTQIKNQTLNNVGQPGVGEPGQLAPQNPQGQTPEQTQNIPPNASADTIYQAARKQYPNLPEPALTPDLFQGTLEPTALGLGPVPKQYTPEQIAEVERADLTSGLPESPRAKFMQNYNDRSREQLKDYISGAAAQSTIAEASANRQGQFRKILEQNLNLNDSNRDDLAIAETIANRPEFKKIANDNIRAKQVTEEVRKLQANRAAFQESSSRPNPIFLPERYNTSIETLKQKAKPLVDYGQRDKVMESLAKNGWSESEIAKITNPLSPQLKSKVDNLPRVGKEVGISPSSIKKTEQENKRVFSRWQDFLKDNITPGSFNPKSPDVFTPGSSLILLRNAALDKGMNGREFDIILNNLLKNDEIKLDPYQQRELQFMSQFPTRVWNLNELLFGGS